MKLSEQVITLEQAQKLEELGIKQESAFYHVHNGAGWQIMPDGYFMVDPEGGESYAAFTVAELGIMLHRTVKTCVDGGKWCFTEEKSGCTVFKTEAEARGALLIEQLENVLSVDTVNKRLNSLI